MNSYKFQTHILTSSLFSEKKTELISLVLERAKKAKVFLPFKLYNLDVSQLIELSRGIRQIEDGVKTTLKQLDDEIRFYRKVVPSHLKPSRKEKKREYRRKLKLNKKQKQIVPPSVVKTSTIEKITENLTITHSPVQSQSLSAIPTSTVQSTPLLQTPLTDNEKIKTVRNSRHVQLSRLPEVTGTKFEDESNLKNFGMNSNAIARGIIAANANPMLDEHKTLMSIDWDGEVTLEQAEELFGRIESRQNEIQHELNERCINTSAAGDSHKDQRWDISLNRFVPLTPNYDYNWNH